MAEVEAPGPRVDWLELFFDLVFVVIIQRLADVLHSDPGPAEFVKVVALFAAVWVTWLNATILVNLSGGRAVDRRAPVLVSMAGVGLVAVSVPQATGSASLLFAFGLAVARVALWAVWIRATRGAVRGWVRATVYGPGSAALWLASVLVPEQLRTWLWLGLGAVELISGASGFGRRRFTVAHLLERVGLIVMIVLGESVVELILAVRMGQSLVAWVVSAGGFVLICLLWWQYFQNGAPLAERVLKQSSGPVLRDVIIVAHFFIVLALIGIAAGLGSAIEHADDRTLMYGSVLTLGGGIGTYHLANVIIAWRYGVQTVNLAFLTLVGVAVVALFATFGHDWPPWLPVALLIAYMASDQTLLPWLWRQQASRIDSAP